MNFPVDIWFIFGTHSYGIEGVSRTLFGDEVCTDVTFPNSDQKINYIKFHHDNLANKQLVKIELRLFPPTQWKIPDVEFPLVLETRLFPRVLDTQTAGLQLTFSYLKPVGQQDELNYNKLTELLGSASSAKS